MATNADMTNQRHSSSSELTNITTTDISSHGEEDDEENVSPSRQYQGVELGQESLRDSGYSPGMDVPVALSDVVVSVSPQDGPPVTPATNGTPLSVNRHMDSDDDAPPPPLPSSLPPTEEMSDEHSSTSPQTPSSPPPPLPISPMPDDEGINDRYLYQDTSELWSFLSGHL